MNDLTSKIVYGTCVALGAKAALLRGPSGSGKSDLAFRFMHLNQNDFFKNIEQNAADKKLSCKCQLVSDDRVIINNDKNVLHVSAPLAIVNDIEVRGIGILKMPVVAKAELRMIVDLVGLKDVPRMPSEMDECEDILGVKLPVFKLYAFEASAPLKLFYMLSDEVTILR